MQRVASVSSCWPCSSSPSWWRSSRFRAPGARTAADIETKLGLDLIGGLRGEYQVVATDDQDGHAGDPRADPHHRREPRQRHRRGRAHRRHPGRGPHLGRAARRRGRGATSAASSAPPACSSSCPCRRSCGGLVGEGPLPEGMLDVEPLFTGVEIAARAHRPGPDHRRDRRQPRAQGDRRPPLRRARRRALRRAVRHRPRRRGRCRPRPSTPRASAARPRSAATSPSSEATNLVTVLKFGSLPLEIREVGFSSISRHARPRLPRADHPRRHRRHRPGLRLHAALLPRAGPGRLCRAHLLRHLRLRHLPALRR